MMFPTFSLALSLVALATISSIPVNALPTQNHISLVNAPLTSALSRRIVYSPRIISPAQGDIWKAGRWAEVTWDTRDIPEESNAEGKILLAYAQDGSRNGHSDIEHPLAESFLLSAGSVKVFVPDVEPRDDYIVDLSGDADSKSDQFSISS